MERRVDGKVQQLREGGDIGGRITGRPYRQAGAARVEAELIAVVATIDIDGDWASDRLESGVLRKAEAVRAMEKDEGAKKMRKENLPCEQVATGMEQRLQYRMKL